MKKLIPTLILISSCLSIGAQTVNFKYDPLVKMLKILKAETPKEVKKMMKEEGFKIEKTEKLSNEIEVVYYSKGTEGNWDYDSYVVSFSADKKIVSITPAVSPQYMYNSFRKEMSDATFFQVPHKEVKANNGSIAKTFLYGNRNFKFQFLANFTDYIVSLVTPLSIYYSERY